MVQTIGSDMFARWARLIGHPELIGDERFKDDISRGDHYQVIADVMKEWASRRTTEEAVESLQAARVPSGPVLDLCSVLEDPQVQARELLEYVEYPGAPKPVPLANTAVRLSATPGGIRRRAPTLGEHTGEVLGELGYSEAEIAQLRAAEVV